MLLTIRTTHEPATDLGYLLHKHPDRVQRFDQSYGTAHVFYPEARPDSCTAALLVRVDPHQLRRARRGQREADFALAQYVNDRPYAASSLFAVALGNVFRSALNGKCAARPELAATALPLTLTVPSVPCRAGPDRVRRLFEPLGWHVRADPVPLDPELPDWGDSSYVRLTLTGTRRVADALSHLYVLLPVLDGAKHYWVTDEEVDKLLRAGGARTRESTDGTTGDGTDDAESDGDTEAGWLATHPERDHIVHRYLARRGRLTRDAISRLAEVEDMATDTDAAGETRVTDPTVEDASEPADASGEGESAVSPRESADAERAPSLSEARLGAVLSALRAQGARRVIDLGCGNGTLVGRLLEESSVELVTGVDVAASAVTRARRRLRVDRMPQRQRRRLELVVGSAVYRDDRFTGHDAAVLMEVVEHIDPERLPAMEHVVFGHACPRTVVVTTPNAEYNVRYEGLGEGDLRHGDHRFEWTRAQFRAWAERVAEQFGYRTRYLPVGTEDPEVGPATQMGVFTR
ncbi:3' terminal RNA ribose 2'-O-methyltransferase Hen1 [Halostreptopolyspora alba]|uniref:Small RNA 2'-O-methyltransferase n=1 Tax=Halostreptopolyspora alba TaxID=2487137 RepID=A0A3N0E4E4_9ACTN|nr:methyltransferase domain-containing protein [Nocardiopsaceae bacterium YIM 96095]